MINGKKVILIFGGGINQLELIKAANDLNIISVVLDPASNPPGNDIADFYYQVAGNDYETTKHLVIKHEVDGIVTGQMEKPLRLMAKLAKEFGFLFNSPNITDCSLNKWLMKAAFQKNKVRCAAGVLFKKEESIVPESLENLEYPLIIKPLDAFSSQGVLKIKNFIDLKNNEKASRSFSKCSSLIVEEFLKGREFSVESLTFKGKTDIIQITEKFITPYPFTVEIGHLQPARLTISERDAIVIEVNKAINAIGINNCASHAEIILTEKGPYLVEIGARLGGDFISSHLTLASTGISMDRQAILIALGLKPDYVKQFNH